MSMNKKKIIWPLIKTILLFLSYKCKNWVFQYLFHSCCHCIQQGNHSDNFQQDQHMWPRFCKDQSHTRPHLWIKLKNSSFMSCCAATKLRINLTLNLTFQYLQESWNNILWKKSLYLFRSCFQCIRPHNHSDNLQQDQHIWLRSGMEPAHTRWCLEIGNNGYLMAVGCYFTTRQTSTSFCTLRH